MRTHTCTYVYTFTHVCTQTYPIGNTTPYVFTHRQRVFISTAFFVTVLPPTCTRLHSFKHTRVATPFIINRIAVEKEAVLRFSEYIYAQRHTRRHSIYLHARPPCDQGTKAEARTTPYVGVYVFCICTILHAY